jgi:hypothetical protein
LTPVREAVVAVRDTHFVRSFHITNRASAGYDAFIFLKQAATTPTLPNLYPELPPGQTTLGQFFPEVPSRYGPMNYVSMTRGDGKGFFLTKPHPRNINFASTAPKNRQLGTGLVGVRMNPQELAQMDMQTRTADESPEDLPEMLMHESIPPERLVMMPQSLRTRLGVDQHDPSTRRNRPDKPAVLGRQYGIDANFVDRNAPPDAQGRAFNFDELGEY